MHCALTPRANRNQSAAQCSTNNNTAGLASAHQQSVQIVGLFPSLKRSPSKACANWGSSERYDEHSDSGTYRLPKIIDIEHKEFK
jgi:hypothetical protein